MKYVFHLAKLTAGGTNTTIKQNTYAIFFFEKDAITVTLQIGDKEVPLLNQMLPTFSSKTQSLWEHRYLCGENGGWVHVRILSEDDLDDAIKLIEIRKKTVLYKMNKKYGLY